MEVLPGMVITHCRSSSAGAWFIDGFVSPATPQVILCFEPHICLDPSVLVPFSPPGHLRLTSSSAFYVEYEEGAGAVSWQWGSSMLCRTSGVLGVL